MKRQKWSINQLNVETGLDRRAISKLLSNALPAEVSKKGKLFWMVDLIAALQGKSQVPLDDWKRAQTRLADVNADIAEVKRAQARKEVIEVETVFRVWENLIVASRRTILTSRLSNEEKDHILNELANFKVEDLMEQREFDEGTVAEDAKSLATT